jgi:guanylate kinase
MNDKPLGNIFIVAAPSGGGKTSLVDRLIACTDNMAVSVSHTTRAKRPGEVEGEHYFFVDESMFSEMVERGEFIEHATVFGHHYGTSHIQIEQRLQEGIDVVLDIDWQGALQIKQRFPHAVSIFILPPSYEALRQRLEARQQDKPEVIEGRMLRAQDEMSHYVVFDFLVVNDTFECALADLRAIVLSYRLKLTYQKYKQRKLLSLLLNAQ